MKQTKKVKDFKNKCSSVESDNINLESDSKSKKGIFNSDKLIQAPSVKIIPIVNFTSYKSYILAIKIWNILIFSIPIDLLFIVFKEIKFLNYNKIISISLIFLVIGFIFSFKESFLKLYLKFHSARNHFISKSSKTALKIAIGLPIIIFIGFEFLPWVLKASFLAIIFVAFIILFSILPVIKDLKKITERHKRISNDHTFWIEKANIAFCLISLAPIIFYRIGFFFLAMSLVHTFSFIIFILIFSSWLLIYVNKPDIKLFMAPCPKCLFTTSRSIQSIGFCLKCSPEKFEVESS